MRRDEDIALLLSTIYISPNGEIQGRKRLQKTVCILEHIYDIPFMFKFRPYFYGPYSEQLVEAMNFLEAVGLVKEVENYLPSGVIQYDSMLTEKGRKIAEEVLNRLEEPLHSTLQKAVEEISSTDTNKLVMIAKSVLR